MNHPYYFQPFWPFISQANFFPIIPFPSFESCVITKPLQTFDDSSVIRLPQKKVIENEKDHTFQEKKVEDKRKTIKKVKQDKNFSYRYQDKDRNIYSNILKGFVLKIREDLRFQSQCEDLMMNMNCSLTLEDLFEFIDQNFHKSKTYISPAFMKKVLESNKESKIGKIFRVLLSKYLKEGFPLVLLASQRIQKHSKLLQMKKSRQLYDILFGVEIQNGEEANNMEHLN